MEQVEYILGIIMFLVGLITTPFAFLKYYFQVHIWFGLEQTPWYRVFLAGIDLLALSIMLWVFGSTLEAKLLLEIAEGYLLGTSLGLICLGLMLWRVDNEFLLLVAQKLNPDSITLNPIGNIEASDLIRTREKKRKGKTIITDKNDGLWK